MSRTAPESEPVTLPHSIQSAVWVQGGRFSIGLHHCPDVPGCLRQSLIAAPSSADSCPEPVSVVRDQSTEVKPPSEVVDVTPPGVFDVTPPDVIDVTLPDVVDVVDVAAEVVDVAAGVVDVAAEVVEVVDVAAEVGDVAPDVEAAVPVARLLDGVS